MKDVSGRGPILSPEVKYTDAESNEFTPAGPLSDNWLRQTEGPAKGHEINDWRQLKQFRFAQGLRQCSPVRSRMSRVVHAQCMLSLWILMAPLTPRPPGPGPARRLGRMLGRAPASACPARRIAPLGAAIALAPRSRGTPEARQNLNAACQWLWVLDSCIGAAHRHEPVRASDLDLLRAIPVNELPPRRLPARAEQVAGLCQGVISSAERVRHLCWASSRRPAWSPGLTVNSLRRIATTSTLTSHHCEILLRSLAARVPGLVPADRVTWLLQAAEAAGHARQGWLRVAHALDRVTTDTRLYLSPDADESADLALWTGRLAYADPAGH